MMTTPVVKQEVVPMSVSEWITVPDNPRQRNTERRLARAKHLLIPSPDHALVHMALAPSGKRWKLDGHTRAMLWQRQMVPAPASVFVHIIPVRDAAAAMDLYDHYDNKAAVKTSAHDVEGAFREHRFEPHSKFVASAGIGNALRLAEGLWEGMRHRSPTPMTEIVRHWKGSLERLDDIEPVNTPKHQKFVGPVVAAALMTFRKYHGAADDFWRRYNLGQGEKIGTLMDPVEALTQYMMTTVVVTSNYNEIAGKALNAFEAHLQSRSFSQAVKALDPTRFARSPMLPTGVALPPAQEAELRVAARRVR
jgi:hypothetical protein